MHALRKFAALCAAALALCCALPAAAQGGFASDALYQDLGGKAGLQRIVAGFLPIVLADARIKDAFKDVDIERLARMLAEQFCDLSGGPCKYSGKDMQTIHADLAISNAQFNALTEDLQTAMERLGIAFRIQNKLVAKLAPMQRSIVTR